MQTHILCYPFLVRPCIAHHFFLEFSFASFSRYQYLLLPSRFLISYILFLFLIFSHHQKWIYAPCLVNGRLQQPLLPQQVRFFMLSGLAVTQKVPKTTSPRPLVACHSLVCRRYLYTTHPYVHSITRRLSNQNP